MATKGKKYFTQLVFNHGIIDQAAVTMLQSKYIFKYTIYYASTYENVIIYSDLF